MEVSIMKRAVEKFHGMIVVSDDDPITVKGKTVVEINSAGELVGRYYDQQGNADDESFELDWGDICKVNATETNITGAIKRALGKNNILISESAMNLVQELAE
jgi:hypothetical protein